MLIVDGIAFNCQADYESAVSDKKIIDGIKSNFDLQTEEGIKAAYSYLKTVSFKSELGDRFDDEVYDLYESVINGSFLQKASEPENRGLKTGKVKKTVSLLSSDKITNEKVEKEIKRQNKIRLLIIASLLIISIGSIGYFVKYYSDARKIQNEAEELSKLKDDKYAEILKNVTPSVKKVYSEETVIPEILDEYVALYNKNKSLIGWIKIADTIIDYPVMQTTDNTYYLKHNFNQENDANGCIFMDCNNDVILGNDNYILYGHHMKSGKMFAGLQNYANEEYYEKHKIIEFDTIYEKGTYEVMFAFRSHIFNEDEIAFKYYQFIDATSSAEFESNMEEMDKLSLIDTGVKAEYGDTLLTLSTCDYQEANGRFVVVAKRID